MENMEGMKQCPFCGGDADLFYKACSYKLIKTGETVFKIRVRCTVCGSRGRAYHSDVNPEENGWNTPECEAAVSAWNLRKGSS